MLKGYLLYEDRSTREVDSFEALLQAMRRPYSALWIDLEGAMESDLESVGRMLELNPESIKDCLVGEQRPRIDEFDDHVFLVLYGVVGPESTPRFAPRKISIFLSEKVLVTAHREPLKTINRIRERVSRRPVQTLNRGADFLLYSIIDGLVDNFMVIADALDDRMDALEDQSVAEDASPELLQACTDLRREMLELRRIATSQLEMLQPILGGEIDYVSESLEIRFTHVRDHLMRTIETMDALRELLHGVRDNYQLTVANRTNSIVQTLTLFASIFLPLTLIAGIYGMNTPLWPSADSVASFWRIIGAMTVIGAALYLYFRFRRWL